MTLFRRRRSDDLAELHRLGRVRRENPPPANAEAALRRLHDTLDTYPTLPPGPVPLPAPRLPTNLAEPHPAPPPTAYPARPRAIVAGGVSSSRMAAIIGAVAAVVAALIAVIVLQLQDEPAGRYSAPDPTAMGTRPPTHTGKPPVTAAPGDGLALETLRLQGGVADRIVGGNTLMGCEPGARSYLLDNKYRALDTLLAVEWNSSDPRPVTVVVSDGTRVLATVTIKPGESPVPLHAMTQGVRMLSVSVQRSGASTGCSTAALLHPIVSP
ncbi:hypothetical protein OG948_02035 [Embleya sp. NBC_00888]|uniref:hypothetical protein n=1 Tax=Embleya sp. NBC_00888 TaxID=2975960 RepID=UPI0038668C1A|nr:hypothetical protein OG948_02035 [Embleya sp. NBC_00888]